MNSKFNDKNVVPPNFLAQMFEDNIMYGYTFEAVAIAIGIIATVLSPLSDCPTHDNYDTHENYDNDTHDLPVR